MWKFHRDSIRFMIQSFDAAFAVTTKMEYRKLFLFRVDLCVCFWAPIVNMNR